MDYSSIQEPDPWGSPSGPQANAAIPAGLGHAGDLAAPVWSPVASVASPDDNHQDGGDGVDGHDHQSGELASDPETDGGHDGEPTAESDNAKAQPGDSQTSGWPAGQPGTPTASPSNPADASTKPSQPADDTAKSTTDGDGGPSQLTAIVTGLDRPERSKLVIRFDVHTQMSGFRRSVYRDVARTYKEFGLLFQHLVAARPEAVVPVVPPSSTSAGTGTPEDEKRLAAAFQRWLNLVFAHPALRTDPEIVFFVDNVVCYSPTTETPQQVSGVARRFSKQMAAPPDDSALGPTRELVKGFYLAGLKTRHELAGLGKSRRALGQAETRVGTAMDELGRAEPHIGLGNALKSLGMTLKTAGDHHAVRATFEATYLGDSLLYHTEDALNLKETLTNRTFLRRDLAKAQAHLFAVTRSAESAKSFENLQPGNATPYINRLESARRLEAELAAKTAKTTAGLEADTASWLSRTTTELRTALQEYSTRHIQAERITLTRLEEIRATVRASDGTGGLSRLGRDRTMVRSTAGSSQGAAEDSWSGLPRRAGVEPGRPSGSAFATPALASARFPRPDGTGSAVMSPQLAGMGHGISMSTAGHGEDKLDARNAAHLLGRMLP